MSSELALERIFQRYLKAALDLHVPALEAFVTLEVFDKAGVRTSIHRQRCKSWTRNAYNMMFSQLAVVNCDDSTFEAGKLSAKDTGGTIRYGSYPFGLPYAQSAEALGYGYRATATNNLMGIVVGSGEGAEDFEDNALGTQIEDGTATGELSHVASEAPAITYASLVFKNTLIRYFNNNSGASIDVNEVALYGSLMVAGSAKYIMTCRDLLGSTVAVADTGQLKVTYEITLTYPS